MNTELDKKLLLSLTSKGNASKLTEEFRLFMGQKIFGMLKAHGINPKDTQAKEKSKEICGVFMKSWAIEAMRTGMVCLVSDL